MTVEVLGSKACKHPLQCILLISSSVLLSPVGWNSSKGISLGAEMLWTGSWGDEVKRFLCFSMWPPLVSELTGVRCSSVVLQSFPSTFLFLSACSLLFFWRRVMLGPPSPPAYQWVKFHLALYYHILCYFTLLTFSLMFYIYSGKFKYFVILQ